MAVAANRRSPADTEVRALITKELKPGYGLRKTSGHFQIVDPEGQTVRDDGGKPITVAGTPGDSRSVKNLRATLKKYDLLNEKTGPKRTTRGHSARPELAGPDRTTQAAQAKERQQRSDALRQEMLNTWIKKLGGIDARGMKADLAAMIHYKSPEVYSSFLSASQTVHQFFNHGGSLSDNGYEAWRGLHYRFLEAEDPMALYVDLIREAKGITAAMGPVVLKPGEEWPYKVELIKLEEMFADFDYQRPEHDAFVRQLMLNFDERLVGVIDVSKRGPGEYAILDGLQRVTTMRQIGKTTCYCAVYEGMSLADEAQYFFHKNKDRKGMSAYYGFRAKVLAGDERSVAINDLLSKAGFKVGPNTDHAKQIGGVRAVEDVYDFKSEVRDNCLPPTLDVIHDAFLGRKGSLDVEIIRGLGRFFRAFGDDEIAWDHWIEHLTALGPLLVLGRARDFAGALEHRGHGKSMASTLLEIHNTGLPSTERLNIKRLHLDDESRQTSKKRSTVEE